MPNMSAMFHGPLATSSGPGGRDRLVAILAHQGGWDELLLVAGPIVVIIAVLAVAKRRVDAIDRAGEERPASGER